MSIEPIEVPGEDDEAPGWPVAVLAGVAGLALFVIWFAMVLWPDVEGKV